MGKLIILLVVAVTVAYGQEYRRCPFWECDSGLYSIRDYDTCLQKVKEAEQCIKNALNEADICETCESWPFENYVRKDWGTDSKRRHCTSKRCEMDTFGRCFMPAQKLLMFYDTSVVDEITSCIDGWNPVPGRAQCLNEMAKLNIPGFIDPIEAIKQVLTEVKAGCDPALSVVKCRGELKPFAGFVVGRHWADELSLDDIANAINGMLTCVQKELKNYPCKTVSTILAGAQSSLVNAMMSVFVVERNELGPEGSLYDKYCKKSQAGNPKFARFAEFFHQK